MHAKAEFAKVYRFLGSIQFAVPLIALIAAILVGSTLYESQVGTAFVQRVVYKSPWFGALMFLLAVNLGVSAWSRYPWRGARKVGFALTHLGLIVLIAGAAAVIHLGVEGMLPVRIDGGAQQTLRLEDDMLEAIAPDGTHRETAVYEHSEGRVWPQNLGELSLREYSDRAIETVQFEAGAPVANPAVQLRLSSQRMGQTLERWLAAAPRTYRRIAIGPAQLELIPLEDQTQVAQWLSPPTTKDQGRWGTLLFATQDGEQTLDVEQALGQEQQLFDNLHVRVVNFWPDFRLDSQNQPTTASEQLRNPAVQLEVVSSEGTERWFVFGQEGFEPVRTPIAGTPTELDVRYQVSPLNADNVFRVLVAPEGQLFYTAHASTGEFRAGRLEVGQSVSPGWADFQITLAAMIPQAQIRRTVVPRASAVSSAGENGVPALLVQTPDGSQSWLPWGEPRVLSTPAGDWLLAFSPKLLNLPFAIALEDFVVERNEGSETVAMWTSKIRIEDSEQNAILRRDVWMNHPTWYRGWKIAQASWNPGDLSQSTLQVKREPLWVTTLTWVGSALVVAGISVMFYGPTLGRQWRSLSLGQSSPTVAPRPETAVASAAPPTIPLLRQD